MDANKESIRQVVNISMSSRKVLSFIQKPKKGTFKTQEEITKVNRKKREEAIKRLDERKT